ncbi:hypothetical protein [Streptomyces sp. SP18CS02]|uniref:hypothetical protein n=1 Tax=Streptomyces sp. SP18CS02 TaxID=3002531 RepID=UPI002E799DD8|nr:hypothetical protein [Streptomyces sp. SP18CS02]MEE1754170.1 hypothetical protein [Streptomyces sp. SP18CS02]
MSDSDSGTETGRERGALAARARAVGVLRVRGRALAVALVPAALAVVLLAGGATGHLVGAGWDAARWLVSIVAVVVLLAAAAVALLIARARPALTPTVELTERDAPDLYRMVRDLAARLDVPPPSAIALTPDCDSWLEDRSHPAHGLARGRAAPAGRRSETPPVLVIGSPFLWWMRVGELRAVLAPVVAGTGPSAHPDIAAARRFVRGLDAAIAVSDRTGLDPVRRAGARAAGAVVRLLLRSCRDEAAEMERGVAAAASERAQTVDYGLRIVAQEQVGLAYAGWDRLLTRVALPAWRMGRWPSRLDAGVVSALTELSRRDRLAEGFTSRLGERPACDLLEEPGLVDEAASLLAARLFHGGPAEAGPDWAPVDWQRYPEEVVDRKWRTEAARLHRVLDRLGGETAPEAPAGTPGTDAGLEAGPRKGASLPGDVPDVDRDVPLGAGPDVSDGPTLARVMDHLARRSGEALAAAISAEVAREEAGDIPPPPPTATASAPFPATGPGRTPAPAPDAPAPDALAVDASAAARTPDPASPSSATGAAPSAEPAVEPVGEPGLPIGTETGPPSGGPSGGALATGPAVSPGSVDLSHVWGADELPLFPLQPPRTGRELLTDHVTAMVCCAAVDTAGAVPGLDWLDGPTLLVDGKRRVDLASRVLTLIEDADPEPLRDWLATVGVRAEKPVRLV